MLDLTVSVSEPLLHVEVTLQLPSEEMFSRISRPPDFDAGDVDFDVYDWAFDG